jgi:hypothetical protein
MGCLSVALVSREGESEEVGQKRAVEQKRESGDGVCSRSQLRTERGVADWVSSDREALPVLVRTLVSVSDLKRKEREGHHLRRADLSQ